LYEDELPGYHRLLADWVRRPENRASDYRRTSLAHHLFALGDREALLRTINEEFLAEKARDHGYAVLEDVGLLTRALLDAEDPALVARCVALVEGLRDITEGGLVAEARRVVQGHRPGASSSSSELLAPALPPVPGVDLYAGLIPRAAVGADFFEVIPMPG